MVCVGVRGLHMRMGGRKHVIVGMNLGTERLGRETRTRLGNGTPRHGFSAMVNNGGIIWTIIDDFINTLLR